MVRRTEVTASELMIAAVPNGGTSSPKRSDSGAKSFGAFEGGALGGEEPVTAGRGVLGVAATGDERTMPAGGVNAGALGIPEGGVKIPYRTPVGGVSAG
jgi:hypothetical protein